MRRGDARAQGNGLAASVPVSILGGCRATPWAPPLHAPLLVTTPACWLGGASRVPLLARRHLQLVAPAGPHAAVARVGDGRGAAAGPCTYTRQRWRQHGAEGCACAKAHKPTPLRVWRVGSGRDVCAPVRAGPCPPYLVTPLDSTRPLRPATAAARRPCLGSPPHQWAVDTSCSSGHPVAAAAAATRAAADEEMDGGEAAPRPPAALLVWATGWAHRGAGVAHKEGWLGPTRLTGSGSCGRRRCSLHCAQGGGRRAGTACHRWALRRGCSPQTAGAAWGFRAGGQAVGSG